MLIEVMGMGELLRGGYGVRGWKEVLGISFVRYYDEKGFRERYRFICIWLVGGYL